MSFLKKKSACGRLFSRKHGLGLPIHIKMLLILLDIGYQPILVLDRTRQVIILPCLLVPSWGFTRKGTHIGVKALSRAWWCTRTQYRTVGTYVVPYVCTTKQLANQRIYLYSPHIFIFSEYIHIYIYMFILRLYLWILYVYTNIATHLVHCCYIFINCVSHLCYTFVQLLHICLSFSLHV